MKNTALPLFLFLPLCGFALAIFPPSVTPSMPVAPLIRDMSKREIPFLPPARRTVIFPPILSDYATIDRGVYHVVATSRPNVASSGLTGVIFPAAARLPVTGPTVDPSDPELVIRSKPDAVFAWAHVLGSLKSLGLPALFQITMVQGNVGRQLEMLRLIGKVAGREERAETLLGAYMEKLKAFRAMLPPIGSQRLRVAILNGSRHGWWIASGKNYYLNMNLEWAGTKNVAGDAFLPMDRGNILERLLVLDPDFIVLNSGADHAIPDDIYGEPRYRSIRAVRERRVYLLPDYMDASIVVRDPLLLLWMVEVFYPGRMPRRLRGEYVKMYRDVYGYSLNDDEIDKVIFLKENLGSAGYERFTRQGSHAGTGGPKDPR